MLTCPPICVIILTRTLALTHPSSILSHRPLRVPKVIFVRLGENVYHGMMVFPATFGISDFVDEIPSMRQQQGIEWCPYLLLLPFFLFNESRFVHIFDWLNCLDRLQYLGLSTQIDMKCDFTNPMRAMMSKVWDWFHDIPVEIFWVAKYFHSGIFLRNSGDNLFMG